MPDSKITALASIGTGTDPVNDALVIVDVSDVSPGGMSATGTTKRVSLNNLLASSPTATLASATITGDLTVDTSTLKVDSTNNRVGILTATPAAPLDILGNGLADALLIRGNDNANCKIRMANSGAGGEEFSISVGYPGASNSSLVFRSITAAINRYVIDQTGAHTWATNAGTAMTLNSTGLGVGASPSYQLHVSKSQASQTAIYVDNQQNNAAASSALTLSAYGGFWNLSVPHSATFVNPLIFKFGSTEMMRLDASGRLLVGRTAPLLSETFSSTGFAIIGGSTNQAIIGEASGNVFAGSLTNVPFRIRTNNTEVAQFDTSGNFLSYLTSTAPTLSTNGAMVFNLTSNTNLRISVRGTDGVTRTANITLA